MIEDIQVIVHYHVNVHRKHTNKHKRAYARKKQRSREHSRPGTRLFNNWRLIEYLKEATRSARLGTRSVLGAAGKVEI